MALEFNLKALPQELKEAGPEWSVTEMMIYLTAIVEMSKLTASNAREFYFRVFTYESTFGCFLHTQPAKKGPPVPRPITYEDVHKRIGMITNASNGSRSKFKNKVASRLMEDSWRRSGELIAAFKERTKNES